VRAHCSRALDFREANRYDARWVLKREIVLNQLEDDNLVQLKLLRHALHCGGVARDSQEAYEYHFEQAKEELRGVGKLLFPYANWDAPEGDSKYKSLWEDWFGVKVGSREWQEMEHRGELMRQWLRDKDARGG